MPRPKVVKEHNGGGPDGLGSLSPSVKISALRGQSLGYGAAKGAIDGSDSTKRPAKILNFATTIDRSTYAL